MADLDTIIRGLDCLDEATGILNQGCGGAPPTTAALERFRGDLARARTLIDAARVLIQGR